MNYKDNKKVDNITTSTSTDYKCYYPYVGDPLPGTYPIITDPLPGCPSITPLTYGTCLCNSCLWKDSSTCPRVQGNTSTSGTSSNKTITAPCEAPKPAQGSKSRERDGEGKPPAERSEASVPEPSNMVAFRKLAAALASQYQRKNEAYGDSFGKSVKRYGVISALTRMSDKWNRLESLLIDGNKNGVKDESVDDTLLDLATYCIMTVLATRSDYEIDRIVEKLEGK